MAAHSHTMHPHGFRYTKEDEGLSGAGKDFGGNAVMPESTWLYTWKVPGEGCSFDHSRTSISHILIDVLE